jgi:formylglycine-generating enzyme
MRLTRLWLLILTGILPMLAASSRPGEGHRVALVVGVSQYRVPHEADRAGVSSLAYAHKDAERVAKKLKSLGWEVVLLQSFPGATDSKATKKNIQDQIRQISQSPDDTFLFYFSGHGAEINKKGYIIPFDAVFVQKRDEQGRVVKNRDGEPIYTIDPKTLLSYEELGDLMSDVPALRRLFVFDSCRNEYGKEAAPDGGHLSKELTQVVERSDRGAPSWGILTSCSSGERSYEDPELFQGEGGGVFTQGLLTALDSPDSAKRDGSIVPSLLNEALATSVRSWCAQRRDRKMTPLFSSEISAENPIVLGEFPVIVPGPNPKPNNPVNPDPSPVGHVYGKLKDKARESGVEMVYIPGGQFQMGDDDSSNNFKDAKPVRTVTLSPYWLSKTPVTVAQFRAFTDSGYRYDWEKNKPDWGWNAHPDYPMVNVSWDDAMAYCTWAGGTLPTEAQWERAAKGPIKNGLGGTKYPWGDEWNKDLCVNSYNSNHQPAPVLRSDRMYQTSEGLLDMAGNVWQWCRDWYTDGYGFLKLNDPENTSQGQYRVLRGGSWISNTPVNFRSASRFYNVPGDRDSNLGFRLAGL